GGAGDGSGGGGERATKSSVRKPRWQRENEQLPPHLRRTPPQRPAAPPGADEWNRLAWEASQARLVPCERCGRTFDPDRLAVHQRSCRAPGPARSAAPGPASARPLRQLQPRRLSPRLPPLAR
ncbi:Zinc finger protein 474, partial [Gryllus bimaculatus]